MIPVLLTPEPNPLALLEVVVEESEATILKEVYFVASLDADYMALLGTLLQAQDEEALMIVLLYYTTTLDEYALLDARRNFDLCGIHTVAWADRNASDLVL